MVFKGRIHIRELEKKPLEITGDQTDPWILATLERAAPSAELTGLSPAAWAQASQLTTQVRVEKIGSDYLVSGSLNGTVPAPCSRCGDNFSPVRQAEFRVVMHRTDKHTRQQEGEDSGDADFVYFGGDDLNLIEILAEQLIVNEPVAEHPPCAGDGQCNLCGLNPHFDAPTDSPLAQISDQIASQISPGQPSESSAFSSLSKLKLPKATS